MQNIITLTNRNILNITGIEKVTAVSPTQIVAELDGKSLHIVGENMEVKTLDVENKLLNIIGLISSVKFNGPKIPFFKRLFK